MTHAAILVVDNEDIVARFIEPQLIRLGYVVSGIVSCKKEALELAKKKRPDLVLMAVKSVGENEIMEAVGQMHEKLDIPVVLLNSNPKKISLQPKQQASSFGCLQTPFSENELRMTI
jgi:CheY-like chemotaxis protein